MRSPEAIIAAVQRAISAAVHAVEQDRHGERGHLLVGDLAAGVRVDDPVDLLVAEFAAVPLGADDGDGVHGHGVPSGRSSGPLPGIGRSGGAAGRHSARWSGPEGLRQHLARAAGCPSGVSSSSSGPPNSNSSCRQRPHGTSISPRAVHAGEVRSAGRRRWRAARRPDRTRRTAPRPYDAFSTLQPDDDPAVVDAGRRRRPGSRVGGVRAGHRRPGPPPAAPPSRRPRLHAGGVTCPVPSGTAGRPPSASAAAAPTARARAG